VQCRADARIGLVFHEAGGEMSVANAGVEGEPVGGAELIFRKKAEQPASWRICFQGNGARAIGRHDAKKRIILLCETVNPEARVVAAPGDGERNLRAFVNGVVVIGRDGRLIRQQAGNG